MTIWATPEAFNLLVSFGILMLGVVLSGIERRP